jgi:hypothetical protein
MKITVKQMEVVVPGAEQQMLGMQTAKVFERELERISGSLANNTRNSSTPMSSSGKGGQKNG